MRVDKLKSVISQKQGIAHQNKFFVELPQIGGISLEDLNLLCRSTSLPGKQILTHERRIGMKFEKVAYGYAVDDVTLSFLILNDYGVKEYFDNWRATILDEEGGTVRYKSDYQHPVKIHQLKVIQDDPNKMDPRIMNLLPTVAGLVGGTKLSGITSKIISFIPDPETFYESAYCVELIDAFPTTISAVEFNNEETQMMELSVQLSYTNWRKVQSSQQLYRG